MRFGLTLALVLGLFGARPAWADRPNGPEQNLDPDGNPHITEDSRWLVFVRLVEARWAVRTQVLPSEEKEQRKLFDRCADDAWYLSRPSLLQSARAPCGRLAEALPAPPRSRGRFRKQEGPPINAFQDRYAAMLVAPSRAEYRRCIDAAGYWGSVELTSVCAGAIRLKAQVIASIDDPARFKGWMEGCKKSMLGGTAEKPDAEADATLRHCLRTLPTLYEVQGLGKLSTWWTADEQKALQRRAAELAEKGGD